MSDLPEMRHECHGVVPNDIDKARSVEIQLQDKSGNQLQHGCLVLKIFVVVTKNPRHWSACSLYLVSCEHGQFNVRVSYRKLTRIDAIQILRAAPHSWS
jgi:hypothetical protein